MNFGIATHVGWGVLLGVRHAIAHYTNVSRGLSATAEPLIALRERAS